MESFLLDGSDFIEMNKLMKILRWVNSGGEANTFIEQGKVFVNGEVELRKRRKLRKNDVIEFWENSVQIQ